MKRLSVILTLFIVMAFMFLCGAAKDPETAGVDMIKADNILAHIKFLSHDLLEGRGTGTRGLQVASNYMASQFSLAGVEPGGENGTYFQSVPLVGYTTSSGSRFEFVKGRTKYALNYLDDFVANSGRAENRVNVNKEIIFVGYGVDAPEQNWNDYKDVDVKDKVLLMLVNDPPSEDPGHFGGKALTYYGRWTYKNEIAGKKGAAGVILIHTTEKAGYGWGVVRNSWSGEQFITKPKAGDPPKTAVESWITRQKAEQLFSMAGMSLDDMIEKANGADFRPVPLGVSLNARFNSEVRTINSQNVVGIIRGKKAEEYIVYSTHLDHLGIGNAENGDNIYNGALDNSTGSGGMIEIGRAFANMPEPPERSIVLVAVTGEESGLLGSTHYAQNPMFPASKTVANINFDSFSQLGKVKNIVVLGAERTNAGPLVEKLAADNGLYVSQDQAPEQGSYFRSDQLSFARVGIPGLYIKNGLDYEGRPEGWGEEQALNYNQNHYHKPSDEYSDDWDLKGIEQMARLSFQFGFRLAKQPEWVKWNDDESFKAARDESLKK
jgi:Zn-dependent M28 family amino/carboxypeptidase